MITETFYLFWRGPFSQWHPSVFQYRDLDFNCAEQWMMFHKALLFLDFDTARQVMETKEPRIQKKLGRQVKNFDIPAWSYVAREIVEYGSRLKYTQNLHLCAQLCTTFPHTLVEASPYDKIWGIGLAEDNPLALDRKTWDGKNWLGETLTKVRNDIMSGLGIMPTTEALMRDLYNSWREHNES